MDSIGELITSITQGNDKLTGAVAASEQAPAVRVSRRSGFNLEQRNLGRQFEDVTRQHMNDTVGPRTFYNRFGELQDYTRFGADRNANMQYNIPADSIRQLYNTDQGIRQGQSQYFDTLQKVDPNFTRPDAEDIKGISNALGRTLGI